MSRAGDDAGRSDEEKRRKQPLEPAILRPSFRNWDHPYRRQIFAGVRLAWDI